MNIAVARKQLLDKERDLQADIARREVEARDDARPEVHDPADLAVSSENTEGQMHQADLDSRVLEQVREALGRIERGTYGKCIDCGRQIEPARLAAIPWTPYCLKDQQRHDRLAGPTHEPTL